MKRICFATNNAHKLEEVRAILAGRFELLSLNDLNFTTEIPEPYETIEENALAKAQFVFTRLKMSVIADDSGLEIQALEGKPGVHSAHYAGTRDAKANIDLVLTQMKDHQNRQARFKSVIAYIDGEGKQQSFEGTVEGNITKEVRGADGFGYDPIFMPEGYDRTFAELSSTEKNTISHRKRALEKWVQCLTSPEV